MKIDCACGHRWWEILNTLAQIGVRGHGERHIVDWSDYESSTDPVLNQLDEAVFEMCHFVANLTGTDGAVVMTKAFELLGFGAEILCNDSEVSTIARAIDLEGRNCRDRSQFIEWAQDTDPSIAFAMSFHGATGAVISQDGNVRFVQWKNNVVTYWIIRQLRTHSNRSPFIGAVPSSGTTRLAQSGLEPTMLVLANSVSANWI